MHLTTLQPHSLPYATRWDYIASSRSPHNSIYWTPLHRPCIYVY